MQQHQTLTLESISLKKLHEGTEGGNWIPPLYFGPYSPNLIYFIFGKK